MSVFFRVPLLRGINEPQSSENTQDYGTSRLDYHLPVVMFGSELQARLIKSLLRVWVLGAASLHGLARASSERDHGP